MSKLVKKKVSGVGPQVAAYSIFQKQQISDGKLRCTINDWPYVCIKHMPGTLTGHLSSSLDVFRSMRA